MAAADTVTPAILQYIAQGVYPDSETTVSADLGPDALANLLEELRKAQDEVKNEVRSLSKDTAPDIDTWISQAKALQQDILRSRDTARAIVAEHEAGRDLRAKVQDKAEQVRLLEKEVSFEETLAGTLEHIRYANSVLDRAQDAAVKGRITEALDYSETAQESIDGLEGVKDTKACGLLLARGRQLRENAVEMARGCWDGLIEVRLEEKRVAVKARGKIPSVSGAEGPEVGLEDLMKAAQRLGIFEGLVQKLGKDFERAILRPRLNVHRNEQVAKVEVQDGALSCSGTSDDTSYASLFRDLEQVLDFLATRLPSSVSIPLSESLIPTLSTRLEDQWLEPAVPLDVLEMPAFQDALDSVQHLVDQIEQYRMHGSKHLRDWVQNAPRTWLTKRRETVLGDVRNLVFAGLRETKVVERVETQMVSKDDEQALVGGGDGGTGEGGEDEWDTAWDEPEDEKKLTETQQPPSAPAATLPQEEDEGSAWDTEDMDESKPTSHDGGDDEGDAWGWGDEEQKPSESPVAIKQQQQQPPPRINGDHPPVQQPAERDREMTLRETFTVTSIPDGILEILQQTISDAQTLAGPDYSSSPIAPAATALYTLPTLALAIYRATAPTAYTKSPTGNMLIYNDASHLSSRLREWQSNQPPASRLRLDADVKALETFAKRAYSSEMESQRTILRDLLDGAGGFGNVTKVPFRGECESAVEQTVDRLREVGRQWRGVLSDGALLQSLGSLLATVTGKMITEIEDLGDIGEEDSHQLRKLMDTVSTTKDLFTQSSSTDEGQQQPQDMTFIYCPNWLKFQYLAEILESSLADIKYLWNEGELSLEFEAEEVVELIEGLFADSDIRRRSIQEIRRGGRR